MANGNTGLEQKWRRSLELRSYDEVGMAWARKIGIVWTRTRAGRRGGWGTIYRLHARSPVWVNILILLAPFLIVAATIELKLNGDLNLARIA
jgi:hypothetical protein